MFSKNSDKIVIVNNDTVHFCCLDRSMGCSCYDSIPLDKFITNNASPVIPQELMDRQNLLLVVPDYWVGIVTYKFGSVNKKLVEAFLERKLLAEFPTLPEINNFYNYEFILNKNQERAVYVYYLHEMTFYLLWNKMLQLHIEPSLITSAAFISQPKLFSEKKDIASLNTAVVNLLPNECSLSFFSLGQFIFSRNISLPQMYTADPETLTILTYEINQSQYLFSQKAGSQLERILLLSRNPDFAHELSASLEREVIDMSHLVPEKGNALPPSLGPISLYQAVDLSNTDNYLSLFHKVRQKEQEWKSAQYIGIVLGLALFFLLVIEALYLHNIEQPEQKHLPKAGMEASLRPQNMIEDYNNALTLLLKESKRPDMTDLIKKATMSLPEGSRIDELACNLLNSPAIDIQANIFAIDTKDLKIKMKQIIADVNQNFDPIPLLKIENIDFSSGPNSMEHFSNEFRIRFQFNLP